MLVDVWLSLIKVPYLPLLGPVHPDCLTIDLLNQVLAAGSRLLPLDKDRRWYDTKSEIILPGETIRTSDGLIIASRSMGDRLKLYCYGKANTDKHQALAMADRLGLSGAIIISYRNLSKDSHQTIVFLKQITTADQTDAGAKVEIINKTSAKDLAVLADDQQNNGFRFLAEAYSRRDLGPTFAARQEGQVVGAIGPIDLLTDNLGRRFCLPPYIGVAAAARGQGIASQLWRQAINYAARQGAEYLILQAEAGQPAEQLYTSLGLTNLGTVGQSVFDKP